MRWFAVLAAACAMGAVANTLIALWYRAFNPMSDELWQAFIANDVVLGIATLLLVQADKEWR